MNEHRGLWRGRRIDDGEWVKGDMSRVVSKNRYYIEDNQEDWVCEVDPSTLGECTGLTDDNGKFIFEGDIIKTKKYGKVVGHSNVNDYDVFVVKYEPAMFRLENRNRAFYLIDDLYGKFEVIGNIHDNPELIQKGVAE